MNVTLVDPLKLDELVRDALMPVPPALLDVRNGKATNASEAGIPDWVAAELVRLAGVSDGAIRVPTANEILSARRAKAEGDSRKAALIRSNPFDQTSPAWNITRQVELRREDPALAAELQALAPRVSR